MTIRKTISVLLVCSTIGILLYYFLPITKIPNKITVDKILVFKSKHELLVYSKNKLIVTYKIAIRKNPVGAKKYDGDLKTPEGLYIICSKNTNSGYHKNLGISYPNKEDIQNAKELRRPTGGDIKIHGLKNGQGWIGKFLRWRDWTNGCIALTDEELDELYQHTPIGTSIEIRK